MTSHIPLFLASSPLEGVVSRPSSASCSTQLACVTACGRRHVHHDSLFLPARIPLTGSACPGAPSEGRSDNFIDILAGTAQGASYYLIVST